jgi:hypothetical protein
MYGGRPSRDAPHCDALQPLRSRKKKNWAGGRVRRAGGGVRRARGEGPAGRGRDRGGGGSAGDSGTGPLEVMTPVGGGLGRARRGMLAILRPTVAFRLGPSICQYMSDDQKRNGA